MRSILPALLSAILIAALTAAPVAADRASGLPTGKRQHKPVTISKNWAGHRSHARRLKNPKQRQAALKLIQALERAKRRQARTADRSHRLRRGRKSRTAQPRQSDMDFLKGRARRSGKGGGDVAMEELTLSHEGLTLSREGQTRINASYNDLRRALGTRTDCVRKCDAAKRRCQSRCRPRRACACIVTASDCLLSELRARRCSSAFRPAWPAKVTGPSPKSDGR